MKILVVEDNTILLSSLTALVESMGHEVHTAMSGSEAFRVVQIKVPFDAIISDMQMKYGTGLDLLEQLYLDGNETPCRLHSSEDFYIKDGERIELSEAVKRYPFASYAPKYNLTHIETFLSGIRVKQES